MKRLWAKVTVTVVLAVIFSGLSAWVVLGMPMPPRKFHPGQDGELAGETYPDFFAKRVRRVEKLAHQLSYASPETRLELLSEFTRRFPIPLRLEPRDEVPEKARSSASAIALGEPGSERVYARIDGGTAFVVAGPIHPPRRGPIPLLPILTVLGAAIVSATLIVVPLVFRIRKLQKVTEALKHGEFTARIENPSKRDALGDLSRSFNEMADQLQSLIRERESIMQAVAHEIGTPLSRMRVKLGMLEDDQSAAVQSRAESLVKDLEELNELTTELVTWVEADGVKLTKEQLHARDALEEVVERHVPPGEGLNARVEVDPELFLWGDRRLFVRAMSNLVRNAAKYARGEIRVSAGKSDTGVLVEIQDDGPGIPAEERSRVLEPFARLDAARTRAEGGAGLGLAIVHRILARHGGHIEIEDGSEGGACIRTLWPAGEGV